MGLGHLKYYRGPWEHVGKEGVLVGYSDGTLPNISPWIWMALEVLEAHSPSTITVADLTLISAATAANRVTRSPPVLLLHVLKRGCKPDLNSSSPTTPSTPQEATC